MTDPVHIEDAKAVHETDKALLVVIDGEEHWIPKSVIHDDSEVYANDHEGELVVAGWFAEKQGWT